MIDALPAIDDHCHLGEMTDGHAGIRRFLSDDLIALMDRTGIDKTIVCHLILPLREPGGLRTGQQPHSGSSSEISGPSRRALRDQSEARSGCATRSAALPRKRNEGHQTPPDSAWVLLD